MVLYPIPQLPVGEDDALICRQLHGGAALQERALFVWGGDAPAAEDAAFIRCREQDGQISEIIIENEARRGTVPPPQRVTKTAVDLLEPQAIRLIQGL